MATAPKRKGRPPKSPEGPATVSLAMRLRPDAYERIRAEAEINGRSISAQAEQRLLREDVGDVAKTIGAALSSIERRWDARWDANDEMRQRCRVAADAVLNLLLGPAPSIDDLMARVRYDAEHRDRVEAGHANVLDLIIGQQPLAREELLRSLDHIQGLVDASDAGQAAAIGDQK